MPKSKALLDVESALAESESERSDMVHEIQEMERRLAEICSAGERKDEDIKQFREQRDEARKVAEGLYRRSWHLSNKYNELIYACGNLVVKLNAQGTKNNLDNLVGTFNGDPFQLPSWLDSLDLPKKKETKTS